MVFSVKERPDFWMLGGGTQKGTITFKQTNLRTVNSVKISSPISKVALNGRSATSMVGILIIQSNVLQNSLKKSQSEISIPTLDLNSPW